MEGPRFASPRSVCREIESQKPGQLNHADELGRALHSEDESRKETGCALSVDLLSALRLGSTLRRRKTPGRRRVNIEGPVLLRLREPYQCRQFQLYSLHPPDPTDWRERGGQRLQQRLIELGLGIRYLPVYPNGRHSHPSAASKPWD